MTSRWLISDSRLEDDCTWEGWEDREVKKQSGYATAPKCSKFETQLHNGGCVYGSTVP